MPLYEYKCNSCDAITEVIKPISECKTLEKCSKCNTVMERHFSSNSVPRLRVFRRGWYEHIAQEPIYIDSMKQLKEECKKHDCTSAYAEDIC